MIHQKLQKTPPSTQSGFTIIESLVAILVVAILLAAIAPVIVISVATRIQAKRVETATDAAKKYVDGVRSTEITAPSAIGASDTFANFTVPTGGSLTCTSNAYCTAPTATNFSLFCIDADGSGCTTGSTKNYVIQAFRYSASSTDNTKGYLLGIRVYRPDAFANSTALKQASKPPTYAAGLGDPKAPLLEMTTEITKGVAFSDFCNRLSPYPAPSSTPTPQSQC